jgi:Sec-independent protein translocase protein TatA
MFIVELPTLGKDIGEWTGTHRRRATDETESLRGISVLGS